MSSALPWLQSRVGIPWEAGRWKSEILWPSDLFRVMIWGSFPEYPGVGGWWMK